MSSGNFSRSLLTVSQVSSTLRVVWDSQATRDGSSTSTPATSSGCSTRMVRSGASPIVPSTSSWPAWPMSRICCALTGEALRLVVHLGDQRAGGVDGLELTRLGASACTAGLTPCAENTTVAPSGTSLEFLHEDRAALPPDPPRRACCGRSACGRRRAARTDPGPSRPSRRPGRRPRSIRAGRPRQRSWSCPQSRRRLLASATLVCVDHRRSRGGKVDAGSRPGRRPGC
jgi:hypothetical protein